MTKKKNVISVLDPGTLQISTTHVTFNSVNEATYIYSQDLLL